jgi:hypothetical protein
VIGASYERIGMEMLPASLFFLFVLFVYFVVW